MTTVASPFSPFVGAVEPITESDDEIRARARGRRGPAAAARARVPHRRPVAAARRPAARSAADRACRRADSPTSSWRPARELALDALVRVPRRRLPAGAAAVRRRRCCSIMEFAVGGAEMADVPPAARRGAGLPRRGPPRAGLAQGRHRARRRLPRRRSSARACRACSPPTGCSRRASTSSIIEKNDDVGGTWYENTLSGLPRRQPEPQLQLLVRAAPRLAVALLDPGRAARLLPPLRRRVRPARPHPVRHRGAVGDVVRRRPARGPCSVRTRRRRRGDDRGERGGQRGRPAQPAVVPRHRRVATRSRARRSTRRGGTTTST